jgi:hypothetical protein
MARWIWVAAMAVLYAAFWLWYGGAGAPVTVEEGAERLARVQKAYAAAGQAGTHADSLSALQSLIARDDGREVFMVNLETARKTPEAAEADAAYARTVLPELFKRGGFPIYAGKPIGQLLGGASAGVDRVVIVRYRSLRDLLDMIEDPDMVAAVPYKFASLERTESFPTAPIFTMVHVRLTLALALIVAGFVGWRLLTPRGQKARNA